MFASLSDIVKIPLAILIGIVLTVVVMLTYYEGVSLPFVGQIINGRVADAADEAREGYVLLAEKTAADAKLAEAQRQLAAANSARQSLEQQIQADSAIDAQREKDREASILEYELRLSQANRRCALTADDVTDILRIH